MRGELVRVDDGPGAPPESMERLSDAFVRGDPARTSGGRGLELAIVEGIAEARGATVALANREHTGFEVVVRFSVAERGKPAPAQ